MVEWTALEMRRTLTGTLGSNPSLSAEKDIQMGVLLRFWASHPGVLRIRSGGKAGTNPSLSAEKDIQTGALFSPAVGLYLTSLFISLDVFLTKKAQYSLHEKVKVLG